MGHFLTILFTVVALIGIGILSPGMVKGFPVNGLCMGRQVACNALWQITVLVYGIVRLLMEWLRIVPFYQNPLWKTLAHFTIRQPDSRLVLFRRQTVFPVFARVTQAIRVVSCLPLIASHLVTATRR